MHRKAVVLLLGASSVIGGCARAQAELPGLLEAEEWVVPWENAFPSDLALDGEGRLWFTDRLTHVIGRFDLATESFESFATPTRGSAPYGMVLGEDGGIWFAESQKGKLGRLDVSSGRIDEFEVSGGLSGGPHLVAATNGEIWFTMREARAYGAFEIASGDVRVWRTPPALYGREVADSLLDRYRPEPYGIAAGPDGRIWIGVMGGWRLYEVEPESGIMREYDLSTPPPDSVVDRIARGRSPEERVRIAAARRSRGVARRLVVDSDRRIWISDFGRSRVVRFDPRSGDQESYESLQQPSEPYGIAVSKSGIVWYSEKRNDRLVGLDPSTGARVSVAVTPGGTIRQVLVDDARGHVWLPLSDRGRIGLVRLVR